MDYLNKFIKVVDPLESKGVIYYNMGEVLSHKVNLLA